MLNRSPLRDVVVFDAHTDLPTRLHGAPADLHARLDTGHLDLPRMREGGVDSVVAALFVPPFLGPERGWRHALELVAALDGQLRPGVFERAVSADQVRRAAAAGVVTAVLALENGRPLVVDGVLEQCAELGVRYVTLTHVATHEWCDAAGDEPRHGGLSDLGVRRVREMRRLGILADVSHVSDDAVLHTLDALRSPVVASHSSARALCDVPRNLSDSLVRDVVRHGGMVMANAYPAFLDEAAAAANRVRLGPVRPLLAEAMAAADADPAAVREAIRERLGDSPLPPVPLARYVDHVVHLAAVAGEESVGIGTDFDGITETPVGLEDASKVPVLAEALLERGLEPAAVEGILGGNLLRLLAEAERRAG